MEVRQQNVMFTDQTPNWDYTVDSMPDSTFNVADTNDATLENFFARPIKIQSFAWTTFSNIFEDFNPWIDYFTNPRVINRISNYNLLRCKLKLRFIINGNGFHYGRAIVSYIPLISYDGITRDRSTVEQDTIAASQRPHIYLDPTTNQGGTLTLPFVYPKNALNIPLEEWNSMGYISLRTMQTLKHANGATDDVTISVFAWAEDVSLSIPTAAEPISLVPQMGEIFTPQIGDEYGTGPISRPANVFARLANSLSSVPGIGPYARATELASSTVSSIATMFGYSRPTEISDIESYKPVYVGNVTNTNVVDTSQKLTLDAKQELTIDPRVMGLGSADEMTIQSISQRESYLTNFSWAVDRPSESLLWTSLITPVTWDENGSELHLPACCFATLPFKYWRGTMRYRFQIVASAFHKGRLKIIYDPSNHVTNEYNTVYTRIVDIAQERDFTVEIGWGSDITFKRCLKPGSDFPPYNTDTPLGVSDDSNGTLAIYTVNDLTVPNSTVNNDISVNVFVSTGDDFEVCEPTSDTIEEMTYFEPQMGEIFQPQMAEITSPEAETMGTSDEDVPIRNMVDESMAPKLSTQDYTSHVYFGDPVSSFRQCLKRYNYHSSYSAYDPAPSIMGIRTNDFPFYRGYSPTGIHRAQPGATPLPYNYCVNTLLNYLTPAYLCRRGGLRWKYVRTGNSASQSLMSITRSPDLFGYAQYFNYLTAAIEGNRNQNIRTLIEDMPRTWNGSYVTHTAQNPVLEAELPFYSPYRFFIGKELEMESSSSPLQNFHVVSTTWFPAADEQAFVHSYVATGEDFTLNFFLGAPVMWRQPSEPAPYVF